MITHIILFRPRGAVSLDQQRVILASLTASLQQFPSVRGCRIGRRVRHGLPGYEQGMREDYGYALLLEFDDVEGLREYLRHPAHSELGECFAPAADGLANDYELMSLADMQQAMRSAGSGS